MGSSVIPQIHQILLVLLQRPRTAPRQKHDVTCYILHFVFCQEVITTQEPPFHCSMHTNHWLFVEEQKHAHLPAGGTLHFHKIVPQQR